MNGYVIVAILTLLTTPVAAEDWSFEFIDNPDAGEFKDISEGLVAPLTYDGLPPVEQKGAALAATVTGAPVSDDTRNAAAARLKGGGAVPSTMQYARYSVAGERGSFSFIRQGSSSEWGWGFGVNLLPAESFLNARMGYTYFNANDSFCASLINGDVLMKLGSGPLVPYGGAGAVQAKANLHGSPHSGVDDLSHSFKKPYAFGGISLNADYVSLMVEGRQLGESSMISLKLKLILASR